MKPIELLKNLNEISQDITATISHATPNSLPYLEQLLDAIDAAADLIEGLIPRPIEEVPKDGTDTLVINDRGWAVVFWDKEEDWWVVNDHKHYDRPLRGSEPNHFIPLSAIQKLMESGE